MKRLLDCTATDFFKMDGKELKHSILASEGRVIVSEVITSVSPLYPSVSNPELAAAFGADLLLLNGFDVYSPSIQGLGEEGDSVVGRLKQLIGRPIGVNLEPVDPTVSSVETLTTLPEGRIATDRSLNQVKRLGFDFVCLTGNPKTGVSNEAIIQAISQARNILGENGLIIAGKMHGAGVVNETGSEIVSTKIIDSFIAAGADVIILPAPGTVPGITVEKVQHWVNFAHQKKSLVMLTIGTSQEGADEQTIRQIALMGKMTGADIFHIGDAGFHGIAVPENIMTYSIAIRGKRHTFIRMASSPLR
jgi:hypothetical protein